MFGIGIWELMIIAVVAIVFLGPDKLPEAMVKIVKFFKTFSKSINEAKQAVEEELNLQELKEDAKKYRELLEKNTKEIKKSVSFDELDSTLKGLNEDVNSTINDIKNDMSPDVKKKENTDTKLLEDKEKPQTIVTMKPRHLEELENQTNEDSLAPRQAEASATTKAKYKKVKKDDSTKGSK
ncbi:MAG: Sec-independent protein translocase protein TatB [Campylobacteraceae bacterium]